MGGLVILGIVLVLVTGGSGSPLNPLGGGSSAPTPPFTFKLTKTVAVTTAPNADHKKAQSAAKGPAASIDRILHDFYSEAFLVPDNWMQGSWDDGVFDAFQGGARTEAMKKVQVLTAGAQAGDAFASITPRKTTLRAKVLFDPKGQATSVVGIVIFTAKAADKTGTGSVSIVSRGQYIFQKVDGQWRVTAFSVQRQDQRKKGRPTPSGAGGATSTPSAVSS